MRELFVDGLGFWSEQLPGWPEAAAVLSGSAGMPDTRLRRPGPKRLAPAERRRAPDTVCLAMQVADEAVAGSALAGADLPCVFASSHGDLPLTDYMCHAIVADATALSPTRFHNSVHNAPAGYWTIAAGAREASTALAAFDYSFGAGLLEALVQCEADNRPLLFVAYDTASTGALGEVTFSAGMLAVAMVLSPTRSSHSLHQIQWQLERATRASATLSEAATLSGNAMSACTPLFEAFARGGTEDITVTAGVNLSLDLTIQATK